MSVIGRTNLRRPQRGGFTLVEAMVALTILPLAVTAIALAIVSGQSLAVEAMRQTRAAFVADALMEEILALPYNSKTDAALGFETGETRATFNSSTDFNGFTQAAGTLTDAAGTAYPAPLQRFSRSVSGVLKPVTVTGLGVATNGLEVTVTVSDASGPVVVLTRFMVDQGS